MIAKVVPRRGAANQTRSSGRRLMAYLMGPGDKPGVSSISAEFGLVPGNSHTEPRVVASWNANATDKWAQACAGVDWAAPEQAWTQLAALSREVAEDACRDLDRVNSPLVKNAIWHTVMAANPADGTLTDGQWAAVAGRLMHETGLARVGSENPVRWVAVRHGVNEAGADHIHVMAVLVRADGSKPSTHNDAFAAQRAARWAEAEFGLVAGRGRTDPTEPRAAAVRADKASSRGEMAAATKAGQRYPRPAGMGDQVWAAVCQEGRDRAWTRQGRTRAAVLSAAARAVSMEHLVTLVAEQGYQVRLRHSTTNPEQVTGWSVVAPASGPGGKPKAYRGAALGADCSWPRLVEHVGRLAQARGTGLVGRGEEEAMIGRERLIAAGWGAELIDDVLTADRLLADGGGDADTAYWLRDVFWQVAWEVEGQYRQHGVFTDAAYAYAAIAAGGVPPVPAAVVEAMTTLRAQYDQVLDRVAQVKADVAAGEMESQEMVRRARAYDQWADRLDAEARPHVPYYLMLPGGQRMTGMAWVRTSLARQNIRRATAAMQQAAAVHRAHGARERELASAAQAGADEARALGAWVSEAKVYEGQLQAALDEHAAARAAWRDGIGRLLVDARALGDTEATARIEALDAHYGPDRPPLYEVAGTR